MKIALRYVGGHLPQGIVEVNEKKVEGLLARGDYILVSDERQKEKIDSDEKPNEKWKEDKNIVLKKEDCILKLRSI